MKVNVSLYLPKSVAKEWVTGKVDISNVVVRSKETGKIIRYLKTSAVDKIDEAKNLVSKIGSKNIIIGLGVTAAVVTVGGVINLIVNKSSEKESVKVPKCINDFQRKFHKYLRETQKGNLNLKTIDELLNSLVEIEKLKSREVRIDFSAEELKFLLSKIYDFTKSIYEEHNGEKVKVKSPTNNSSKNLVYLKDYLECQKQVLEKIS